VFAERVCPHGTPRLKQPAREKANANRKIELSD
jgi:hypothetical protein